MTTRAFNRTREQVTASVLTTMARESSAVELRMAYVRVAALLGVTALNTLAIWWPGIIGLESLSPLAGVLDGVCLLLSVAILVPLRRGWYPAGIDIALPGLDGAMIFGLYGTVIATSVPPSFVLGLEDLAVYCALLAISGGLRLRRASAVVSTMAALFAFVTLTTASGIPFERNSHVCVAIAVCGLFGYWLTRIVRASLEGEISRTIFRRFLPEHLVEQARLHPMEVIGEPRLLDATVLLTDLRGFTALSESLAPGELLDYLSEVQGLLADIVRENGGVVDKFMGDGMLAVFGAPELRADHAQRGIAAATDIIRAIERLNGERRARGKAAVAIGIGVHTGNVIAGCLGSGSRLEFTVIGDTVNATSRLESLTKQLGVAALISEDTVERAGRGGPAREAVGQMRLTRRGEMPLRGRVAPLSVYALEAAA